MFILKSSIEISIYSIRHCLRKSVILFVLSFLLFNSCSQDVDSVANSNPDKSISTGIFYEIPRVYNLDISFEISPNPSIIDRSKDLKVWIPIPREWDSQRNVQIISVQPEPHSKFTDPEYGNKIFYWDFGKYPEKPSYCVDIKVRLVSFSVQTNIDASDVKPYDKKSKEYELYTRSGHIIHITPKVEELAKEAVGDETNPFLKAQMICSFTHRKIRFYQSMNDRSLDWLLSHPIVDERQGEELYTGACTEYAALFVALCRSQGIPARCVYGRIGWNSSLNEGNSKTYSVLDTMMTEDGFAGHETHGLGPHMWSEFYLQDIGWIPVDANAGVFGRLHHYKIIMSKGRDIFLGPNVSREPHNGYGFQWVPINNGRAEGLLSAVYNIGKITKARSNVYHSSDPFPADAYAEYANFLYPEGEAEQTLISWRKDFLLQILSYSLGNESHNKDDLFTNIPSLNTTRQAYVLHLLRQKTGNEKFREISKKYANLLLTNAIPVSTEKFEEIAESVYGASLDLYFDNMINNMSLSAINLDGVINELSELFRQEDVSHAVDTYKKLGDANPDDYDFSKEQLNGLGVRLRNRNMFSESIKVYKLIVELYPDWFESFNGIADVYRLKGDKEQAINNYAKSLELYPDIDYARAISEVLEELTKQDD